MYDEIKEITREELNNNPDRYRFLSEAGYNLDNHKEGFNYFDIIDEISINLDKAENYIPIQEDKQGYFLEIIDIKSEDLISYRYYIKKVGVDNGNER